MENNINKNTMIEMTWPEVERYAQANATVLLPLGVIEEHGPHLCLGTDIYLATAVTDGIRRVMEKENHPAIIAPPLYWGIVSCVNTHFPGTFTAREETIKYLIHDIIMSLKNAGFNNIVGLNLHGDIQHRKIIREAIKESREQLNMNVYYFVYTHVLAQEGLKGSENYVMAIPFPIIEGVSFENIGIDVHAGAIETAMMYDFFPSLVNTGLAESLRATDLSMEEWANWSKGDIENKHLTPDGYLGNPALFRNYTTDGNDSVVNQIAHGIMNFLDNNK